MAWLKGLEAGEGWLKGLEAGDAQALGPGLTASRLPAEHSAGSRLPRGRPGRTPRGRQGVPVLAVTAYPYRRGACDSSLRFPASESRPPATPLPPAAPARELRLPATRARPRRLLPATAAGESWNPQLGFHLAPSRKSFLWRVPSPCLRFCLRFCSTLEKELHRTELPFLPSLSSLPLLFRNTNSEELTNPRK